jgi:hypothetical protein
MDHLYRMEKDLFYKMEMYLFYLLEKLLFNHLGNPHYYQSGMLLCRDRKSTRLNSSHLGCKT